MRMGKHYLWVLAAYFSTVLFLCLGFGVIWLIESDPIPIQFVLISSAIIVSTQYVFVLPIIKPPRLTIRGKSLLLSACLASVIAALMTLCVATFVFSVYMTLVKQLPRDDEIHEGFFFVVLGVSWLFWTVVLLTFVNRKKRDPSALVRITSWLFAGSIIEFLLSIPLAILVSRRTNCYCSTGSFIALIISFLSAIWLFGPFMIIVIIWRKRPWTKDHCFNCGYPRDRTTEVCSECGKSF